MSERAREWETATRTRREALEEVVIAPNVFSEAVVKTESGLGLLGKVANLSVKGRKASECRRANDEERAKRRNCVERDRGAARPLRDVGLHDKVRMTRMGCARR